MIQFNELRIDNNKNLIIDVSILDIIADPNKIIEIDKILVGVGSNIDTIDVLNEATATPTKYVNSNYYLYTFAFDTMPNIALNDVYRYTSTANYDFTVLDYDLENNKVIFGCDSDDVTIGLRTLTSPITLTKQSGSASSDSTITYNPDSDSYSVRNPLRGVRIMIDLTNSASILLFGEDAYKHLIYVEVHANTWTIDTGCSIRTKIEGYTYDKCLLFNRVFDYIKSTDNPCDNIDSYANYIVQTKGLELAVESGNFNLANTYWNKFFGNNNTSNGLTFNNGCRCHR